MALTPHVLQIRERRMRAGVPPLQDLSLAEARALEQAAVEATADDPREPVHEVHDRAIPGAAGDLPIRVYRPGAERDLPGLVYFHSGGGVLGGLELSDEICRHLANAAGCVVVSVDYRLAPEAKFPAGVTDAHTATLWVAAHAAELGLDPARLALGGDSIGGNFAAVVARLALESGPDLVGQLLITPNTDMYSDTPSMRENTDPWFLNAASAVWFRDLYLAGPDDGLSPLASPLLAPDLRGLPPALVVTAEHDPLRDQGEEYAARLADAGVPVTATRYDGMMHGFFSWFGMLDGGTAAMEQTVGALRDWFAASPRSDA